MSLGSKHFLGRHYAAKRVFCVVSDQYLYFGFDFTIEKLAKTKCLRIMRNLEQDFHMGSV
jgi:hypothetical protein